MSNRVSRPERAAHNRSVDPPMGSGLRLKERNIAEEHIPPRARAIWPSIDPQVGTIAVIVHNMVVNPATGQPWNGQTAQVSAPAAFAQGVAMGQEEAVTLSEPEDAEYLQRVDRADEHANLANAMIEDTDKIPDDSVEFPPGSWVNGREAVATHRADRELAAEREQAGDSRHRQREIERIWVVLAAVVLTALDMMLLWRPLLNLGEINTAGALYKWVLALAFAGAQAFFIDLAVHKYRERERDATERRDAVRDHNRAARRSLEQGDLAAVAQSSTDIEEIRTADRELQGAYRWLLTTAAIVCVIGVVRVTFLSRGGGQSVAEATLFGAVVGLMLGGVVLLLGSMACRGNRLGERLRAGAAVVADIGDRIQEGEGRVGDARDAARTELAAADRAHIQAENNRAWALGQYRQALLLATSWLALAKPPVDHTELIAPRELAIADAAAQKAHVIADKLRAVDQWLVETHDVAPPVALPVQGTSLEGTSGTPTAATGRLVDPVQPGGYGGTVRVGDYRIDPPPSEPRWLILVAAVAAIGIAFGAATMAPAPGDDPQSVPAISSEG